MDTESVESYMMEDEEVTYSFTHRPTGLLSWLKSLFGYGESQWYVTDNRLIVYRRAAGGFDFQEMPLSNVSSVEYGRSINLQTVIIGLLLTPLLVGLLVIAYAVIRKEQTLQVHISGGDRLAVAMSRGEEIDEFLYYAAAQRRLAAGRD